MINKRIREGKENEIQLKKDLGNSINHLIETNRSAYVDKCRDCKKERDLC
jgi:hypothetical protein